LASWHMDPNLFRKWRPLHAPNGIKQRVIMYPENWTGD
jgi:hypothetical protein